MDISIQRLLEGAKRATEPKPTKETVDPKTANSGLSPFLSDKPEPPSRHIFFGRPLVSSMFRYI